MQAIEIGKILAGDWERVAVGREVMLDANFHRHFVTRYDRNPACKFDHRTFAIRKFRGEVGALTLADLFAQSTGVLRVEGHRFARQWACGACLAASEAFGLHRRLAGSIACPKCGSAMRAVGFHMRDRLAFSDVPDAALTSPLSQLGFRAGDLFTRVIGGEEIHSEITPAQ